MTSSPVPGSIKHATFLFLLRLALAVSPSLLKVFSRACHDEQSASLLFNVWPDTSGPTLPAFHLRSHNALDVAWLLRYLLSAASTAGTLTPHRS
jgi:hypothetical protein